MSLSFFVVLAVAAMLVAGTANTISLKIQNDSTAIGTGTTGHKFAHAGLQTMVMFAGESFVLFFAAIQAKKAGSSIKQGLKALRSPLVLLPTFFDMLGTFLGAVGLLHCEASVWQMLRGTYLVFTGLVSLAMRKSVKSRQWVGIILSMIGAGIVGVASLVSNTHHANGSILERVLFTGLVILSQLPRAIKAVLEARIMDPPHSLGEMELLGAEGIYGFILILIATPIIWVIPGSQPPNPMPLHYNSWDNLADAIMQMIQSTPVLVSMSVYFVSVQIYGVAALKVTHCVSAVDRAVVDAVRTLFVWGVQLFIHYVINSNFGENWSRYSWIQVAGFAFMVLAMFISNGAIPLSWCACGRHKYQPIPKDIEHGDVVGVPLLSINGNPESSGRSSSDTEVANDKSKA